MHHATSNNGMELLLTKSDKSKRLQTEPFCITECLRKQQILCNRRLEHRPKTPGEWFLPASQPCHSAFVYRSRQRQYRCTDIRHIHAPAAASPAQRLAYKRSNFIVHKSQSSLFSLVYPRRTGGCGRSQNLVDSSRPHRTAKVRILSRFSYLPY